MNYKMIFSKYPEINAAYLFGSRARGDFSLISDFDFAVQLSDKIQKKHFTSIKLNLLGDLCRALKTDVVDIVILNDAPVLLKHRILRDRKILYCRSHLARIRFETKILTDYLDEKDFEMAFTKNIFKNLLETA